MSLYRKNGKEASEDIAKKEDPVRWTGDGKGLKGNVREGKTSWMNNNNAQDEVPPVRGWTQEDLNETAGELTFFGRLVKNKFFW